MSKRNIILIAIVIGGLVLLAFVFMYFYKPAGQAGDTSSGTNFISQFFPFAKTNPSTPGTPTSPANVSGYVTPNPEAGVERLTKVSSMPIAGYGVFMKERYKDVALIEPTPPTITPPIETPAVTNPETPLPNLPLTKGEEKGGGLTPPKTTPTPPQTEFVPELRYVERATGNIYQTFVDKIEEQKFTTTTVPKVYEAYFGNNSDSVVMRYLNNDNQTIETFFGDLPKEMLGGDTNNGSEDIKGSFLPEDITDMSMSPTGTSMFYIFNSGDSAIGVTAQMSGNNKNQIFNSGFTEWLTSWPNDRMLTLTTKPSYVAQGFMYSLDPITKKMNKILSGIYGLTTLTSPSGKFVLYGNNNLTLSLYNIDTKESTPLGVKTMPEKCVWNSESTNLYCAVPQSIDATNYPDSWYQGETSFSDQLWKINIDNGSAVIIANPLDFKKGEAIDGIKLSLDPAENYLFFVNKKDSYLWKLSL